MFVRYGAFTQMAATLQALKQKRDRADLFARIGGQARPVAGFAPAPDDGWKPSVPPMWHKI